MTRLAAACLLALLFAWVLLSIALAATTPIQEVPW